jgi:hypothetical protein
MGEIVDDELLSWFEREGLVRYAAFGEPNGGVTEVTRGPLVALGPYDDDYYLAPHPGRMGYRLKPLSAMSFDDFQAFMLSWFEHAVRAGEARCANCDRRILETTDEMADADTWDAIFIEKELVAWMLCHFDCKKQLPKRLKGRHPFELRPQPAPIYDLADEVYGAPAPEPDDADAADRDTPTEEDSHG